MKFTFFANCININNCICIAGIHGLKVVGRLGGHGMSEGDNNCNHSNAAVYDQASDGGCGGGGGYEYVSESNLSQVTDPEFEHDTADYQWLLDYESVLFYICN